jgi:hypothetical protein
MPLRCCKAHTRTPTSSQSSIKYSTTLADSWCWHATCNGKGQGYHATFVIIKSFYYRRIPFYQQFDWAKPDIVVKCGVEWELSLFITCRHHSVIDGLTSIDSLAFDECLYSWIKIMNIWRNLVVFNRFGACRLLPVQQFLEYRRQSCLTILYKARGVIS